MNISTARDKLENVKILSDMLFQLYKYNCCTHNTRILLYESLCSMHECLLHFPIDNISFKLLADTVYNELKIAHEILHLVDKQAKTKIKSVK